MGPAYRRLRQANRWHPLPGRPLEEKSEAALFFPAPNTSCAFPPRGKERILHPHFRESPAGASIFLFAALYFIISMKYFVPQDSCPFRKAPFHFAAEQVRNTCSHSRHTLPPFDLMSFLIDFPIDQSHNKGGTISF